MNKKLPTAAHLTDGEYNCLLETYAAHNASMGLSERGKYTLSHITKVERGNNCLHVYYDNGDWWHYALGRKWY